MLINSKRIMRKKILLGTMILINLFIGCSLLMKNVYGYMNVEFYKFQTDKETYYFDEEIIIDVDFDLYYIQLCYGWLQLHIINDSDDVVWESQLFNGTKGHNYHNETLHIFPKDFDHTFNDTNHFELKWYYRYTYWDDGYETEYGYWPSSEEKIDILKHNATSELFNLRNVTYGDQLDFKARFFDNNTDIPYQDEINCKNFNRGNILFNFTYIPNAMGEIDVHIEAENYSIGLNKIIFQLLGNENFSDEAFEFNFTVFEQSMPPPDVSSDDLEDELKIEEDSNIILLTHYILPIIVISSIFIAWSIIFFYFIKLYKNKHFKF